MIDLLFWAWVIVTALAFIDLIIPDPLPFIDEAILILLFFVLLGVLIIRTIITGLTDFINTLTHPAIIAFAGTLLLLFIIERFRKKPKKKKR